jgi:glycosyltransferase involved in cell wall biosynthesis
LPDYYRRASLFINLSTTGSLDKAVLEALACECPVITTNEAFRDLGDDVYTDKQKVEQLSELVISRLGKPNHKSYRQWVVENHSLQKLIPKIIRELGKKYEE